jgi:hypothetical protein
MLYIYWSTNGNTVGVKVEKYNHLNNLWSLVGSGSIGNYPGHTTFKHDTIPYHPSTSSPSTIKQMRITFETTHNNNTNSGNNHTNKQNKNTISINNKNTVFAALICQIILLYTTIYARMISLTHTVPDYGRDISLLNTTLQF